MVYDVVIIGGGIVGLATAYQILQDKPDTKLLILEKEAKVASHQTGHNSGVIHSGLYYKPGSLKAINCKTGYDLLIAFADKHNIPYDLCGKVVVATQESELPELDKLYKRGIENGLDGLKMIDAEELKKIEPHVAGIKGIIVPQTGIIDYTLVSQKYLELVEKSGGEIRFNYKVNGFAKSDDKWVVRGKNQLVESQSFINCAGLYSDKVAGLTETMDTKIIPFRGEYYMLKDSAKHLVKHLIYPVPDPNFPFLGVHFTRMMNGHIEAGPNAVLAFRREGYKKRDIHFGELLESLMWPGFQKVAKKYWRTGLGEMYRSFSKKAFTKALQKLIPEITADDLVTAEAGVRAQACDKTGGLLDDFKIIEKHGAIHVVNAPSPAATSSLAIGKTVAELWSNNAQ
ncbi:MAG: L-2-hydroxyglutarate oxidase [Bacteroidetes bacterium]|jgi:L-2-hydroxyglutarate oxidase|nr:L-2-hydroxyglutarate oxidase [Bacteroidota bacterium]